MPKKWPTIKQFRIENCQVIPSKGPINEEEVVEGRIISKRVRKFEECIKLTDI